MDANRSITVYFYTNGKPQRKPDKVSVKLEDVMAGRGIRITKNDTFLYNDKVIYHTNGSLLKKVRNVVDQSKFVLVPTQEQFVSAPYDEIFPFHYGDSETKRAISKQLMVHATDSDKLFCPHHNRYCRHSVAKKRSKSSCCGDCGGDDDEVFTYKAASTPPSSRALEVVQKPSQPQVIEHSTDDHESTGKSFVTVDVNSAPTASTTRDFSRQMERIDFECKHGTHAMKIYRFGRRRSHKKKQRSGCCGRSANSDSELENA